MRAAASIAGTRERLPQFFFDHGLNEAANLDNLPAHKGPRIEEPIKAVGAELRYLPPYSPDMNPIEKAYSKLKTFLRKIAKQSVAELMRALEACAHIFKPAECANYFAACGIDTT
jgi:transposase